MKKLSLLLLIAITALCASASVGIKTSHDVRKNKMEQVQQAKPTDLKSSMRVIYDQPEGELHSYLRSGKAIYPEGNRIYTGDQIDGRMDVVFAEDGKVYLKNILYNIGKAWGNNWVEGQLSDDGTQIIVPMGQSVYHSYTYDADIVLAWGSTVIAYNEDGTPYIDFIIDERTTEVVYTIDGETITLEDGIAPVEDPDNEFWDFEATGLGTYWTDDMSFAGALEWNTVFTETEPLDPTGPTVITEQPEGDLYTLNRNSGYILFSSGIYYGKTDGDINLVLNEEEGKAYIMNPLWWHDYGYWVEGTYDPETGMISIPTGQYIYYNEDMEYGIQLMWGSTYVSEEEDGYYLDTEVDFNTEEINFLFMDNALYLLDSEGDVMADFPDWGNATGMVGMYSYDYSVNCIEFANWNIYGDVMPFGQLINTVPAIPEAPIIDGWYDGGDEEGNSFFIFYMPTTDIEGNLINPECLSFSVYVDNGNGPELFTFEADTYVNDLWEDMTEIPYELYAYGVDISAYGCTFYRTNEGDNPLFTENIGVQAFYEVDGVKNASEIAWLYERPSSVNEMNAGKSVASVRYFNVTGQEMAQPQGLTIKVTTYTDGTTSAVKVVK